jgi:hypothetical protein
MALMIEDNKVIYLFNSIIYMHSVRSKLIFDTNISAQNVYLVIKRKPFSQSFKTVLATNKNHVSLF